VKMNVPFDIAIPATFVQYAADILGDTSKGLSGGEIVRATSAYAVEYNIDLPHPTYPFDAPNKRTALYDNLMAFGARQQYRVIKELCDHRAFGYVDSPDRKQLKIRLVTRYSPLDPKDTPSEINETLIEETKHWLADFPQALALYSQAQEKYEHGVFHRNVLDDLRLSLERLVRDVLGDNKSLENQQAGIGSLIKSSGGSSELGNMFLKLVDYYAKYQNSYVKHDDAVIETEIEFVFEITSSFMKHIVRIGS
jgi:hypothetical protein